MIGASGITPIPFSVLAIGDNRIGCVGSRNGTCTCLCCRRMRRGEGIDSKGDILREKIVRCGRPDKEDKSNDIINLNGEAI